MKKLLTILIGLVLSGSVLASTHIAVINLQRVFKVSPEVSAAQKKLKKDFLPQKEEIQAQQQKLKNLLVQFNKNNTVMKDTQRKTAAKRIEAVRTKLISMLNNYHQNVIKTKNTLMSHILDHIKKLIRQVAQQNNIDLVLLRSSVPYSADKLDITDKVVKLIQ